MEQTGSVLLQTLAGVLLDSKRVGSKAQTFQDLLNSFVVLNILQFCTILLLAYLQYQKDTTSGRSHSRLDSAVDTLQSPISEDQRTPLLANGDGHSHHRYSTASESTRPRTPRDLIRSRAEGRRGKTLATLCIVLVMTSWVLFMTTAWLKLGKKGAR